MSELAMTQIKDIVNQAYKEYTGQNVTDVTIDLTGFTETGDPNVAGNRERFTKALLGVMTRRWYTDASYRSSYKDDFFVDADKWGAIISVVSIEVPEAKDNSAWKSFVSGQTTVGQYTVYLPVISEKFYCASEAWSIPITITGEQWDTACRSESDLNELVAKIFVQLDNKLVQHMEDLNNLNRANFIAEKIHYSESSSAKGVQVVDLVGGYVAQAGISTAFSVEAFLNSKDACNYAIEQIELYSGYLKKQSALFNTENKVKFVPADRLVTQLLDVFYSRLKTYDRSGNFRSTMESMPKFSTVPAWQNMAALDFDTLSTIDVKTSDGHIVNKSGIVGFMGDKWCIMHTIRGERVGSQYFGIENLTHYEYQHRDQYMNNLALNSVVFVLKDHTVTA